MFEMTNTRSTENSTKHYVFAFYIPTVSVVPLQYDEVKLWQMVLDSSITRFTDVKNSITFNDKVYLNVSKNDNSSKINHKKYNISHLP